MKRTFVFLAAAAALLSGVVPSAGAVTLSPPSPLDFGTVAVGSSASQGVTITGDTTPSGNNVISNVSLVPGSAFSIFDTSCNAVPPPGFCHVTLVFTPVGAGPASGTLQGTETNPGTGGSAPFTYSLTGTGTAPPPELPEVPAPWALPLVAGALFGASFWILRRRATAAVNGRGTE